MEYILLIIGAILVNNFVLSQFLGICAFLGVSKSTDTALGMGLAVTFVMSISSIITYALYIYVLLPLNLVYLNTIVFILIIAALVQIVEMVIKKYSPSLYSALGVYLPLISTNCAVLGVTLLNIQGSSVPIENILMAFLNGFGSGVGYTVVIVMMAGIREKLAHADIPVVFKGFPISLIIASIMAMAFAAFSGMI